MTVERPRQAAHDTYFVVAYGRAINAMLRTESEKIQLLDNVSNGMQNSAAASCRRTRSVCGLICEVEFRYLAGLGKRTLFADTWHVDITQAG